MKDFNAKDFKRYEDTIKKQMIEISNDLYENPELSGEEYKSKEALKNFLKKHAFKSEDINFPELETAFIATYDSGKPGPTIAYLAEYDALPSVGHGCGHNLIATVSSGAAILLSKALKDTGGKVLLMGTPAEETYGGKIPMAKAGYFDNVDIAIMSHPSTENKISGESLAYHAIELTFEGKAAHAAADPEKGVNALSAMMLTFMGINAMREHFTDDVRVHGIIADGGAAPNIIPAYTKAKFYLRAQRRKTADEVREKFYKIVRGAELMTGSSAHWDSFEYSFDDMNTNKILNELCTQSMEEMGMKDISRDTTFKASIDMGNVSYLVPSIHPFFDITNGKDMALHSKEFAECTCTDYAHDQMYKMASSLAITGLKVLLSPNTMREIRAEFEKSIKK